MRKIARLYLLAKNKDSIEACKLVTNTLYCCSILNLSPKSEKDKLEALYLDLELDELPVLIYQDKRYRGLKEIKEFLNSQSY